MSIYDVLLAQQEGDSLYEICGIYNLWPLQVKVAFEYIEEHRERLEAELPKLLEQKAARERHYRAIAAEREKEIRALPMTPKRKVFYELHEKNRQRQVQISIKMLSDINCIGQVEAILHKFDQLGYAELFDIKLFTWDKINLDKDVDDETLWHFCQDNDCLLIAGNQIGNDGRESAEYMTRNFFNSAHLPVLIIGNLKRALPSSMYSTGCAERLADIISELDKYRGVPRPYLS